MNDKGDAALTLKRFALLALAAGIAGAQAQPEMRAHFIDVGQASAALLEFRGGAILIDAGGEVTGDTTYKDHLVDKLLDVDVFVAAHYGSHNGINEELMEAVTPKISILSAGQADRKTPGNFHAFQFGHPRQLAVDLLETATSERRPAKTVPIFPKTRTPKNRKMEAAVYCTCWDGDIVVSVLGDGSRLEVATSEP